MDTLKVVLSLERKRDSYLYILLLHFVLVIIEFTVTLYWIIGLVSIGMTFDLHDLVAFLLDV